MDDKPVLWDPGLAVRGPAGSEPRRGQGAAIHPGGAASTAIASRCEGPRRRAGPGWGGGCRGPGLTSGAHLAL